MAGTWKIELYDFEKGAVIPTCLAPSSTVAKLTPEAQRVTIDSQVRP